MSRPLCPCSDTQADDPCRSAYCVCSGRGWFQPDEDSPSENYCRCPQGAIARWRDDGCRGPRPYTPGTCDACGSFGTGGERCLCGALVVSR